MTKAASVLVGAFLLGIQPGPVQQDSMSFFITSVS